MTTLITIASSLAAGEEVSIPLEGDFATTVIIRHVTLNRWSATLYALNSVGGTVRIRGPVKETAYEAVSSLERAANRRVTALLSSVSAVVDVMKQLTDLRGESDEG